MRLSFDCDFKRNPYKGKYVAVEGIDGSGKSTQVERLKNYFAEKGEKVIVTQEPSLKFATGKLIREILASKVKMSPGAFQFIYSTDRVLNHEKVVVPALQAGKIVITHRCFWSALSYGINDLGSQSYSLKNISPILVAQGILSFYHQFIVPDKTFYLDVTAETAVLRMNKMGKKKDIYEKSDKLDKIVKGYRWIAKQFPKEIVTINGEGEEQEVTANIIAKL